MHSTPLRVPGLVIVALLSGQALAQGPGSCGFHLDFIGGRTATHGAIADIPGAPGALSGMAPTAPGNPYVAYTSPGAPFTLFVGVPRGTLGPSPLGAGSCLTLLYSFAGAVTPLAALPPIIPPCESSTIIVGVLPIDGTVFDSCGLVTPAPLNFSFDPGWPNRITLTGTYSPNAPPVVMLQGAMITPSGQIGLTNAVAVISGTNPNETSRASSLVSCGAGTLADDSQALAIPTPPGFSFYGVPTASADMDVNGFLDFLPGAATGGGCDTAGTHTDFGCTTPSATARPRVDVCHADWNLGVPTVPGLYPDMTTEFRPAGPTWPASTIFRWKHVAVSGTTPTLNTSSFACELLGDGRIVVVRSKILTVDQVGIGPGLASQGYGAPPPTLATCSFGAGGFSFSTVYGTVPFVGSPGGVIHMDSTPFSDLVHNLAIEFTPDGAVPATYTLNLY